MASNNYAMPQEEVITQLMELFGTILTLDVVRSVAQNCRFDMQRATEKLCELASCMNQKKESSLALQKPHQNSFDDDLYQKELHIQKVIEFIKEGWKVLILLRGMPGSGKSYLANIIFEQAIPSYKKQDFILSTDDYFCKSGSYIFNPNILQEAHLWNQRRCFTNMKKGISPIIIDNTNTKLWEMRPYCLMAMEFGYCIEVIEPTTNWAFNVNILAAKNIHNVSKDKLLDMLARYEPDLTPEKLSVLCNLQYKVPLPQRRRLPPFIHRKREIFEDRHKDKADPPENMPMPLEYVHPVESKRGDFWMNKDVKKVDLPEYIHEFKTTDHMRDKTSNETRLASIDDLLAFQSNRSEPLGKPGSNILIDLTMDTSDHPTDVKTDFTAPSGDANEKTSDPYSSSNLKTWGLTEDALVSWEAVSLLPAVTSSSQATPQLNKTAEDNNMPVKKVNQGTNTSVSDFNLARLCLPQDGVAILTSQNRIISKGLTPKPFSPSKKMLVDKSSMTNEEVLTAALKRENPPAENLEKLVQMFPGLPKEFLSDFHDKCVRDLNWTVDLLIENGHDSICTSEMESNDFDKAGTSEKSEVEVKNEIVQDDLINFEVEPGEETPLIQEDTEQVEQKLFKQQEREELKKHLEESVDINKDHYSSKLWQIINFKRGKSFDDTQTKESAEVLCTANTPSSSSQNDVFDDAAVFVSDEENEVEDESDCDNLIDINLGQDLVSQLQKMFGGSEMGEFEPIVQMPESFARQLHALYLESMSRQMETQREAMDAFLREDEVFAKKLQEQEDQSLIQKPQVSNLTEIMDEQLALNLYKKDVDKWKDVSPDDLASKLTRQKLIEAFPTVEKNLLVEILQAHNNNFRQTVETLLDSTDSQCVQGNHEYLKEPPISEQTLQEMKMAHETMSSKAANENEVRTAVSYRKEANEHMHNRRESLQKVQMYQQRGMGAVAAFYANAARRQLQLAELANQKASCMFIEENADKLTKNTTLDLHYLYVKEAMHTLDIFIDHHISCLVKSKKPSENLYIITGRGKRSEGGISRLRPAVINRLRSRNIQYHQVNLGLLKININKNLLMSTNLKNGK